MIVVRPHRSGWAAFMNGRLLHTFTSLIAARSWVADNSGH